MDQSDLLYHDTMMYIAGTEKLNNDDFRYLVDRYNPDGREDEDTNIRDIAVIVICLIAIPFIVGLN